MEIEIEYSSGSGWSLPRFRFRIKFKKLKWDIKAADLTFTEVEGLDFEDKMLEYRGGADTEYSKINMPGMFKYNDITIKRGTFEEEEESRKKWVEILKENTRILKDDVSIQFLDEKELPVYEWDIPDVKIKRISVFQPDESEELYIKKLQFLYKKEKMTERNLKMEQQQSTK